MTTFELLVNLPVEIKSDIRRIQAKPSNERTTAEAAVLTNYNLYINNKVISRDADNNIVSAQGTSLPTGYSGFTKSATFRKTDVASGTQALYENTGDTDSAVWNLVGNIVTADIGDNQVTTVKIADEAVTAGKLAAALDLDGKAVSIPSTSAPVNAVAAESVVTVSTLIDGDTVTIGETVYRFKTTPAQAYDVALGANDAAALDNLKLAINANGTGDGSDYYTGTLEHPDVEATTNTDTTQKIVAKVAGTAANSIATTSTGGTATWADTTLGGGTGDSVAGVDGTVGAVREIRTDGTYLYVAVAANTVADANWRRVSLGSAY